MAGSSSRDGSPHRTDQRWRLRNRHPSPIDRTLGDGRRHRPDTGPTSRGEILEYGLSPAQYVRTVVTEHGCRIKQRRFADEYGWSSSTRLLSDLEDRGVIERYRIGREKIVRLPETEGVARDASGPRKIHRQQPTEIE